MTPEETVAFFHAFRKLVGDPKLFIDRATKVKKAIAAALENRRDERQRWEDDGGSYQ